MMEQVVPTSIYRYPGRASELVDPENRSLLPVQVEVVRECRWWKRKKFHRQRVIQSWVGTGSGPRNKQNPYRRNNDEWGVEGFQG